VADFLIYTYALWSKEVYEFRGQRWSRARRCTRSRIWLIIADRPKYISA
jgi:hypothetical protein